MSGRNPCITCKVMIPVNGLCMDMHFLIPYRDSDLVFYVKNNLKEKWEMYFSFTLCKLVQIQPHCAWASPPLFFTSRASLTQWKLLAPERRVGLQTSERVYHLLPLSWLPIIACSAGLHSAPTHVPSFPEPICTEAAALQGEMAPAHCLTLNTAKFMPRRQHTLCKHSLAQNCGGWLGKRLAIEQ